ncbi:MAG TPA: 50S ribosomal protein L21 [Candidatus Hydrogenedentes bacterium]|jgi:large subunit ribosomal protein L21|nr:50S ribosomal protein L21 [Candidatus Hydrogenedentota bacterium]
MYAVIKTGGKQYKVAENSRVRVEKLDFPVGERIELNEVQLVIRDNAEIVTDAAALNSARVVAEIEGHGKSKKIRVYKKKRRKGYERTQGHRQAYTLIRIEEIKS